MKRYMQHILQSTEVKAESFLKAQVKDATRPDFGGLTQTLIDVKPTVYDLLTVITVYTFEKSRYYKNKELCLPIRLALDFIERELRQDGTLDYPSCNFASAPDTAFCLKQLTQAYQLFNKFIPAGEDEDLKQHLKRIIKKTLIGIKNGGFHTPNHRWAIAASLMQGTNLFKDDPIHLEFKKRANQYLAEGIDGNEDGEYAERSTGNYNAVVNTSLITLYEETGDEKYLSYVKRNLEMMLNYFDPDDTIFTQNSTRQDKGKRKYGNMYFYQFLYIAEHNQNELLAGAAHKLIHDNEWRHEESPLCLSKLMLNERLMTYEFKSIGFLEQYRKYFKDSGVVRFREGDFSYSILENKKKFLYMQMKDLQLFVRIGISYCHIRSFEAQEIKRTEEGYQLEFNAEGWYYQPFETEQSTTDWWTMDHQKRELLINTRLKVLIQIKECKNGLDLEIKTEGCDKIPIRVEVALPDQGMIETDSVSLYGEAGHQIILKNGMLHAQYNAGRCLIGPGFSTHQFTGHYSGEEKNNDQFTAIMTEYTPISKTLQFRFEA